MSREPNPNAPFRRLPKFTEPSTRWTEVAQGAPVPSSCLSCPPRPAFLRWDNDPDPGFGMLTLLRDGTTVAERLAGHGVISAVRRWRSWAREQPDHEWVIQIEGPMTGVRYTRQRSGQWIATHRSIGFA